MREKEVVFLPVRQLGELIRTREVSPVELTEIFLKRLETLGPQYNAVVTVTRERAVEEAREAEKEIAAGQYRGPLHGIPYGVKDLLATSGSIPTTWGAAPLRHQTFDYDATVILKLRSAGAILTAKLAMIELAGGMGYRQPNASFTGPCSTPWNRNAWSGGSSSGSGASVAAGLVPFAIGSETWGSIMSPAANCGVAGLRPTYGRVSRYGAMALCWTLDKLGPLCLTADDCGLVLEAIAGPDPNDPSTSSQPYRYDAHDSPSRRFKLGLLKNATEGAQDAVRGNFEQSLKVFESFATIEEVDLPDFPYEAVTRTILSAEAASAFDEFIESGKAAELTAPEDHYGGFARTVVLAKDYLRALRIRGLMAKAIDEFLSHYDAIVALNRLAVASPIDQEFPSAVRGGSGRRDPLGAVGNGAGLPSISVPNGFGERGLPTAIQFVGRAYEENTILAIARRYQQETNWHMQHPPGLV
ncbi:MAG: amidase [Candidatus Tectomicrobia bacterium]|nr:amidase [Candidatus Tectomicrobia bacterium]